MEREVKFLITQNYSKQDGTYILATVKLTVEQEALVIAIKHYVMVLLHKKNTVGNVIPTYIKVVDTDEKRAWSELSERDKWKINYRIIEEYYNVLDVIEKEEDTSPFTLPRHRKEDFCSHCNNLTEDQKAEVSEFLETLNEFGR